MLHDFWHIESLMLIRKSWVGQVHIGPSSFCPVGPSKRAIAYLNVNLREKFTLGEIERERMMRWCECPTQKLLPTWERVSSQGGVRANAPSRLRKSTGESYSPWDRMIENYAVMRMSDKEASRWQSVARSLSWELHVLFRSQRRLALGQ